MTSVGATDRRERARNAIRSLAVTLGLPDSLEILSERWNTVVRLGDSGIIAKAATLSDLARSDPQQWFQQEVDVCRTLRQRGAPVQHPYAAGLHMVDGLPITLWHEVAGTMGTASEQQLVDSLAAIHRLGGDLPHHQPWFATLTTHIADVVPLLRHRQVVDDSAIRWLEYHLHNLIDGVQRRDLPSSFIHGDAQRKNAIATVDGACWIDFEECSFGPSAWDLACLTMNRGFDLDRVLDRYAEMSGQERTTNRVIADLQQLRNLEAVTWMLCIQHEREPAFQQNATELLHQVMTSVD